LIDRRTADSVVAALLIAIGLAQFWGGYTMDRLEIRQIHPASIPGLLPMILGVAMVITAAIVFVASRRGTTEPESNDTTIQRGEIFSFIWVAGLAGLYALVLVGRVHFWLGSSLFVASFIFIAEWGRLRTASTRQCFISSAVIVAIAITIPGAIAYLFEDGFLVRLP
jgi:putative tricarboxylic transport membrane protein